MIKRLKKCQRCARFKRQFIRLRDSHPDYWNRPVAASGSPEAPLAIVGLAPGMHGANRTGVPFRGMRLANYFLQRWKSYPLRSSL